MLKVDVEGFEADVLAGATELLERNDDVAVMVELAPIYLRRAESALHDLLDALPTAGRSAWIIDDHAADNPYGPVSRLEDAVDWIRDDAPSLWYANLLSVPVHQESTIRDLVGSTNP
jgi:hypothetical protein